MKLTQSLNSAFTKIGVLRATFGIRVSKIWEAFDRRDLLVFGGLVMLWYGLNIYSPAVAYSVCGGILLSVGLVGYVFGGNK